MSLSNVDLSQIWEDRRQCWSPDAWIFHRCDSRTSLRISPEAGSPGRPPVELAHRHKFQRDQNSHNQSLCPLSSRRALLICFENDVYIQNPETSLTINYYIMFMSGRHKYCWDAVYIWLTPWIAALYNRGNVSFCTIDNDGSRHSFVYFL